jgi:hypothetical protein
LDGFATGTAGASGGNVGGGGGSPNAGTMNPTLKTTTLDVLIMVCPRNCAGRPLIEIQFYQSTIVGFAPEGALAWRTANYALAKLIEIFTHVQSQLKSAYETCMGNCDGGVATVCPVCSIPVIFRRISYLPLRWQLMSRNICMKKSWMVRMTMQQQSKMLLFMRI